MQKEIYTLVFYFFGLYDQESDTLSKLALFIVIFDQKYKNVIKHYNFLNMFKYMVCFFLLAFIISCMKSLKSDENVPLVVSLYKREKELRRREFEEKIMKTAK